MFKFLTAILVLVLLPQGGRGLTIQLDYTYDTAGTKFFTTNPTAKQALERAASDLSALISSPLVAVPSDVFTGTNGQATATIDWKLTFGNPDSGNQVTLDNFALPADTVRIFVGARSLSSTTLGVGGPGGAGFNYGTSYVDPAQLPAAEAQAESRSNAAMSRGAGPTMGTFQGQVSTLAYGSLVGSLSFDNDSDNNGTADNSTLLNQYWHFDMTTLPTAGQNDFYSVALHELLHTLGMGTSKSWNDQRNNTDWLGAKVKALNGNSGTNLVTLDGHIRDGLSSTTLRDGTAQEPVMDPSILTGTRKYLTTLDVAFLQDIGYAVVPEAGAATLLMAGVLPLLRRRPRGPSSRVSPRSKSTW